MIGFAAISTILLGMGLVLGGLSIALGAAAPRWRDSVIAMAAVAGVFMLASLVVNVTTPDELWEPTVPAVSPPTLPAYDQLGCVQLVKAADTGAWVCVSAEQAG